MTDYTDKNISPTARESSGILGLGKSGGSAAQRCWQASVRS